MADTTSHTGASGEPATPAASGAASAVRDDPRDGRQLIVCCDGTANTLSAGVKDTNVVRLVEMLRDPENHDVDGPPQVVYYDPGVGSPVGLPATGPCSALAEPIRQAINLSLGRGVYENIGEAYLFLCREYGRHAPPGGETADQIYLFGFSRGAFTVRCVAGMVNLFGIIRPGQEHLLPMLLNIYFSSPDPPSGIVEGIRRVRRRVLGKSPGLVRKELAEQVTRLFASAPGATAPVHFLGVWDTVQSVGLPGMRKQISSSRVLAGKRITHSRHALAIDEHRSQFLPRMFCGPLDEGQTLSQLWFRGVHTDVGGGRRSPLPDSAFVWMVEEARKQGLAHTGDAHAHPISVLKAWPQPDLHLGDQLYHTPWWSLVGMAIRDPGPAWSGERGWVKGGSEALNTPREHLSVAGFSPPPNLRHGPTAVDKLESPWEDDPDNFAREPRTLGALVAWTMLGVVGLLVMGLLLEPPPRDGWDSFSGGLSTLWEALRDGVRLEWAQLTAVDPRSPSDNLLVTAPHPGWALFVELIPLAGWTYVMARFATRWFSDMALWRRVGGPEPRMERLVRLSWLGYSVTFFAAGAAIALLLHLTSTWAGEGLVRNVLMFLGGIAACTKWFGGLGVGALGLLALRAWWVGRKPPRPRSHPRAGTIKELRRVWSRSNLPDPCVTAPPSQGVPILSPWARDATMRPATSARSWHSPATTRSRSPRSRSSPTTTTCCARCTSASSTQTAMSSSTRARPTTAATAR